MAESTTKSTRERARKLQIPGRSKMSKAQLDAVYMELTSCRQVLVAL